MTEGKRLKYARESERSGSNMQSAGRKKKPAVLPRGRNAAGLKIELPFEDAIRAALQTPQPDEKPKRPSQPA
jgi:hypothetical protein